MQRRETPGQGLNVSVRCRDEFLSVLDAWRRSQADPPTRSAALRRLAELALERLRPIAKQSEVSEVA